jgi:uncharacterized protein YgbK (DUF1537 family)
VFSPALPSRYRDRTGAAATTAVQEGEMTQDSLPGAAEVLAALPQARADDPRLRASIRAARATDGLALGVIDDDPTGSQAVHGVQAVLVPDRQAYVDALRTPAATCFALTNSRSVAEPGAVELTMRAAADLAAAAGRNGQQIRLLSRGDSTLRGHVLAEPAALATAAEQAGDRPPDAVLFAPAYLEAGRVTAADVHWARTGAGLVPVGQTEFARDAQFGYQSSDLREFLTERSSGRIAQAAIASLSLPDIRLGGPGRVRALLTGLVRRARQDGGERPWVVVNATEYSDLEIVALGVLAAERDGGRFVVRTGPSFVRALAGLDPRPPLRGQDIPRARRGGHGLIVVGSHVSQTSRQLDALLAGTRGAGGAAFAAIELDVAAVLADRAGAAQAAGQAVAAALRRGDVVLYTSRIVRSGAGRETGQLVSAALAEAVRRAMPAGPAWIVAKGGITAHDVAVAGLGIRRAEVAGQLFPGQVSVLVPADAGTAALGVPYVVFPGNVGGDDALREVVAILDDAAGCGPGG